jgi:hypothetical protein
MGRFTNAQVLGEVLRSLYHVAGRRTTQSFAAKVIGSIIKTLERNYDFLKYVRINEAGELIEDQAIAISPEINNIEREKVGRAIESIIRVVYMDIIGKAGLFFIAELKKRAGEDLITELHEFNVDLPALQIEQHYLYRRREQKKIKQGQAKTFDDVSLLGYTWKNVSSWKYDPSKRLCVLYDRNGNVLDNLNLEAIIENYVKNLSKELEEVPDDFEKEINISDKEFELLKLLYSRDMDADSAMVLLHLSQEDFDSIIKNLLYNELLQYTSFNIIELTEIGVAYITKKEEKNNDDKEKIIKEIKQQTLS